MSKEQRERKENEQIDAAFQELLDTYLASPHSKKTELITKAYTFAKNAHHGIRRLSGEAYILHPITVAHIVCKEIGLGSTSICAALLHDVVEDTEYTIDDIQDIFGEKIAHIVDGLTKIAGGVFGKEASAQAENFRKLILTMSTDIRVILIKIADRLHNMRTLDSQSTEKQYKIAGETEYIYAPLAHRLGLFSIKTELENLSFKYNFPQEYRFIEGKLEAERERRNEIYDRFSLPIMNKLNDFGFQFVMKERIKSEYSIWKKMQAKHIPFEEVYDIFGSRIVFTPAPGVDEKLECWRIYNMITSIYPPHPERTRDWLQTPKSNGYEALHVTVMGPDGLWMEVQIRSKRMDDIAEKGLAAHWNYKKDYTSSESKIEEWLNTINELLKNPDSDAMQFLDSFKLSLYDADLFVFTPKGDLKTMPAGSTALDFAFELHTELGLHCIGAKVNNKLVPLSYQLQSGDQVEVLTAKQQCPKPEWFDYVTTPRAKEKLGQALRQTTRGLRNAGDRELRQKLLPLGHVVKGDYPARLRQPLLDYYKADSWEHLLIQIGLGQLDLNDLEQALQKKEKGLLERLGSLAHWPKGDKKDKDSASPLPTEAEPTDANSPVESPSTPPDSLFDGKQWIATCCHPIPGDKIIGFKDNEGHIILHKRSCPHAMKLKSQRGNRIVAINWTPNPDYSYPTRITIQGTDRPCMLLDILLVISRQMKADILQLHSQTNAGLFTCHADIYASHVDEIHKICDAIQKLPDIVYVARTEDV